MFCSLNSIFPTRTGFRGAAVHSYRSFCTIACRSKKSSLNNQPKVDPVAPTIIRTLRRLDMMMPKTACVIGGFLICGIGIISYASCPQFSSSLLYLIPVLVVTRVAGIILGILAAFLAALIWFSADQWSAKDQQREAEFSPLRKLLRNLIFPCSKRQLRRLSLLLILTKPCSRPT